MYALALFPLKPYWLPGPWAEPLSSILDPLGTAQTPFKQNYYILLNTDKQPKYLSLIERYSIKNSGFKINILIILLFIQRHKFIQSIDNFKKFLT